jgi:hypothetical protein
MHIPRHRNIQVRALKLVLLIRRVLRQLLGDLHQVPHIHGKLGTARPIDDPIVSSKLPFGSTSHSLGYCPSQNSPIIPRI